MTDETGNLVLQHLRAIREEMKDMRVALDTGLDDVRVRMDNFDKHMEGFLGELVRINTKLTLFHGRVDRLERDKAEDRH